MTIFEITIFWITIAPSYYWLMYVLGFLIWFHIVKKRWKIISWIPSIATNKKLKNILLDDLFLYIFLWVIVWGRIWYVLFYNLSAYLVNPISIFKVWEWWMSFHGWVIWVVFMMFLFSWRYKLSFLALADQVTLVLPIWLWLGRIWNYLNGELLWYSWYEGFLAVYRDWIWYFPSPLLEAFLEWLILFIILNFIYYYNERRIFSTHNKSERYSFDWQIACLFLIFYWIFRIFIEMFFRTPDAHIWYIFWYFTMWELLTLPMIIFWIIIYRWLKFKKEIENTKVNLILKPFRSYINDIDTKILLMIRVIFESWLSLWIHEFSNYLDEALSMDFKKELKNETDNWSIVDLLHKRFRIVKKVWVVKKENDISVLQEWRWKNILLVISEESEKLWLDKKLMLEFWELIHWRSLELEEGE